MEKQKLSYATGVLILGILSILSSCCYGIGLLFSIIALVLFSIDAKKYRMKSNVLEKPTMGFLRKMRFYGLQLERLSVI